MIFKRQSAKKWLLGLGAGVAAYGALWLVTEAWGVPQVRRVAIKAMEQPLSTGEPSGRSGDSMAGPVYECAAGACAPFVIRADYRWENGEAGNSGSRYYVWLFGPALRVCEARPEG
jgi:hypothetical protein